jgi:acylphosphatase
VIAKLVVHGIVQGVGYRYFVKREADSLGVSGFVENLEDGSVLVVAEASAELLEKLESNINVSLEHGIQVFKIERSDAKDSDFKAHRFAKSKFVIKK